ncbi:MAG: hypothetical protein Q4B60_09615 [Erysipelotrichaceae bacterium]|nr:hypothetical protein [Erysipelotrichaceae bacterium]
MVTKIVAGAAIYLLATIIMNFCCKAIGFDDLSAMTDMKYYVALLALVMTLVLFIFSRIKGLYGDKKNAALIYSGFAIVNFFIYNMNSYMNLLYIGMNNSIEKLSQRYPTELAESLLDYYNKISTMDVFLLCVELVIVFFILKKLFELVTLKGTKIYNYVFLMVGVFCLYTIQYCINNTVISFVLYFVLLGILLYSNKTNYGKH